ncbi:MAG: hypothetical protein IIT98_00860, partial [Kiritimatiellae bacterium]|nr:hypothetical protein [Kiritimatiellia bacterium]
MTYSRKVAAMGAAAVCFAAAVVANAQTALPALAQTAGEDEIINLLEELAPETPVKAEEKTQPAPAQPEEKAPAKVAESPAPEAKPAAAPESAAVEAPEPAPAAKPAPEPAPAATPAAKPAAAQSLAGLSDEDAQLVESLRNTELLRVKALSSQVERELAAARECSAGGECYDAARHYALSLKFIKQLGAPANFADARKECEKGIPENLYKYALQEDSIGRRERAILVMEKALAYRHPQAKQKIDEWKKNPDKDAGRKDVSEISQVRNTSDYKTSRDKNIQRLKRSSQFFGVGNIQEALNECELVLKDDPYNEAALKIRAMIQKKRQNVMATERKATHDGMIADVDEAWRPIYAVNAHEVDDVKSTRKKEVGPADPNRTLAQSVIKRMKEMRLPAISFKPPATIIDAVEYFKQASVDFDNPELPIDQRGFNFMLKLPETLQATAATQEAASGFSEDGDAASSAPTGVPQIPLISASDISLFEALKLVCESVQYKFTVQGSIVIVMHKNAAVADMITRSYPVITSFVDKARSVSEDVRSLNNKRGGGFGSQQDDSSSGEEGEIDWKKVFGEMGVAWPEGSSVYYMKATGKLRVRNTEENLAELERALVDLEAEPRLVEIEARFVEVCQEDLNSLGFEWILNSDYSLNLSKHLGKHVTRALGLKRGVFGSESGTTTATYDGTTSSGTAAASSGSVGGVNTTTGGGGTTAAGGSGEGAPS